MMKTSSCEVATQTDPPLLQSLAENASQSTGRPENLNMSQQESDLMKWKKGKQTVNVEALIQQYPMLDPNAQGSAQVNNSALSIGSADPHTFLSSVNKSSDHIKTQIDER